MSETISKAVERRAEEARRFLIDILRFESTPGNEREAVDVAAARFGEIGCKCEIVPIDESIKQDPEYSHADPPLTYDGRGSLVALRKGTGGGRSVILQSHMDVVPGGEWRNAFFRCRKATR